MVTSHRVYPFVPRPNRATVVCEDGGDWTPECYEPAKEAQKQWRSTRSGPASTRGAAIQVPA
jgi:hypothetical protein